MKTKIITHNKTGEDIEIDKPLVPLIESLNRINFLHTLYCCAGHNKEQFYITFKYNIDTFYLLNKVFDFVQEKWNGSIHIVIDINTLQCGQKCITIRSRTQQGLYCNLKEQEKTDFCEIIIQGFTYWLYCMVNSPKIYNCRLG